VDQLRTTIVVKEIGVGTPSAAVGGSVGNTSGGRSLGAIVVVILVLLVAIPLVLLGLACAVIAIPFLIVVALLRRMLRGHAPRVPLAEPERDNVRVRAPGP
jgi:xanthine/uracil/vitamin C permease (AzgA family)